MSARTVSSSRRTGRRSGESTTREAILETARTRFAKHGYDGATIRGIAADAGVDPALVHHFYGSKARLFVDAMRFPVVPSEVLGRAAEAGRDRLGESILRTVLDLWDAPETREQSIALLRSAVTNERAATMLRGFVTSAILGTIAGLVEDEDAEYRATLVASQILGLPPRRCGGSGQPRAGSLRRRVLHDREDRVRPAIAARVSVRVRTSPVR